MSCRRVSKHIELQLAWPYDVACVCWVCTHCCPRIWAETWCWFQKSQSPAGWPWLCSRLGRCGDTGMKGWKGVQAGRPPRSVTRCRTLSLRVLCQLRSPTACYVSLLRSCSLACPLPPFKTLTLISLSLLHSALRGLASREWKRESCCLCRPVSLRRASRIREREEGFVCLPQYCLVSTEQPYHDVLVCHLRV